MASDTGLTAVALGLASAATWGVGDFSGGLATRRTPVLVVTLLSQVAGISFLAAFAAARAEAGLAVADAAWGALAGVLGLIGLVGLYRAMAIGQMALAAPVTGVLSAGLPVAAGALIQGWPGPRHLAGFGLALTGIGLLSKTPAGPVPLASAWPSRPESASGASSSRSPRCGRAPSSGPWRPLAPRPSSCSAS